MQLTNNQRKSARFGLAIALFSIMLFFLSIYEGSPLYGIWALTLLSVFAFLSGLVIFLIMNKRAKKMDRLISGEKVVYEWQLDQQLLNTYVQQLSNLQRGKSKMLIMIMSFFFVLIGGIFMFTLKEADERLGFLTIFGGVFVIVFIASRFFPWYYTMKNKRGDGKVVLGKKYAYVNGYFHNWDFPMSGIKKLKAIKTPFKGIQLVYYYTTNTFTNTHELNIPVPENIDEAEVIKALRQAPK